MRPDLSRLIPRILLLLMLSLILAACRNGLGGQPTPFPTATRPPTRTPTPIPSATATPAGVARHEFLAGGFSLLLPEDWIVVEQGLTPLGQHYLLGREPLGPGPESSAVFVASAAQWTAAQAAAMLLCGNDSCAGDVAFEETGVAGERTQRAVLQGESGPPLTWYFMERDGRLIYLSLHDPLTLGDRFDLLQTLTFDVPTPTPPVTATHTPAPTGTATPTAQPTLEPVRAWRRIVPAEAQISFEVPAGWAQENLSWHPTEGSPLVLGFAWQPVTDTAWAAEDFFPAGAQVESTASESLTWAPEATRYTVQLESGPASYVVVPAGEQIYAFFASAPDAEQLTVLQSLLQHMLESVRLDFIIETVIAEPSDTVNGFFTAIINDPLGDSALLYLSPRLREEVPDRGAPLDLLQLPDRLIQYNLDWQFQGTMILVTADITLQDGSTVSRELTLVNLGDIGWRIDAITAGAEEPAG